jgi:hypothetical protein
MFLQLREIVPSLLNALDESHVNVRIGVSTPALRNNVRGATKRRQVTPADLPSLPPLGHSVARVEIA